MTIRWPWVSVRAYELLEREHARIVAQNAQLLDSLIRFQRHDAGLPEILREARQRADIQPMPKDLREYIEGFRNPSLRKDMRDRAYRRHARGEGWDPIAASMLAPQSTENGDGPAHE